MFNRVTARLEEGVSGAKAIPPRSSRGLYYSSFEVRVRRDRTYCRKGVDSGSVRGTSLELLFFSFGICETVVAIGMLCCSVEHQGDPMNSVLSRWSVPGT